MLWPNGKAAIESTCLVHTVHLELALAVFMIAATGTAVNSLPSLGLHAMLDRLDRYTGARDVHRVGVEQRGKGARQSSRLELGNLIAHDGVHISVDSE